MTPNKHIAVWFEIPVHDIERATRFYSQVLDVTLSPMDFGPHKMAVFPGGRVQVNGKARGTLPNLGPLKLDPGRYVVEIRYAEYPPLRQTVELKAGQQFVVEHQFREKTLIERLLPRK